MKLFQETQKNMRFGGYERNRSTFNSTHRMNIFSTVLFLISITVYALFVANTPKQYMDIILSLIPGSLIFISSLSITIQMKEMFDLIDNIERYINESKCFIASKLN